MTIDGREEWENAEDSILRNNESGSINIDESDLQWLKQAGLIISTVRRIRMEVPEQRGNAFGPIARTKRNALIWTINRRRRSPNRWLSLQFYNNGSLVEQHKCNTVKHDGWLIGHPTALQKSFIGKPGSIEVKRFGILGGGNASQRICVNMDRTLSVQI
jgi:hypothetical protein